jgi:hypothetical protein
MEAIVVSLFHQKMYPVWAQKAPKSTTSGQHDHAYASNAKRPRISLRREMAAAQAASIAYSNANDLLVVFADLLSSGL